MACNFDLTRRYKYYVAPRKTHCRTYLSNVCPHIRFYLDLPQFFFITNNLLFTVQTKPATIGGIRTYGVKCSCDTYEVFGERNMAVRAVIYWNGLPANCRMAISVNNFKAMLKEISEI